ncbi:MAG TPA: TIGR00730 family Rossman fold protein [Solirubrobacteraceae bacterium]|jgi:hypothetical protein|nr:TIGR00730 family Rossman fold protein [Solirubrobacteraceae bacterium]
MQRICVYAGSSPGRSPAYAAAARELGVLLAERGITIVYGGGRVGLMGVLADAALGAGGRIIGVIPRHLAEREVAHERLTELHVLETMHERKALMADLAEAFIALPGGFGTLDELVEVSTWAQLRLHDKPIGLLDVEGYWHPLLELVDHAVREGFIAAERRDALQCAKDGPTLLAALERAHVAVASA